MTKLLESKIAFYTERWGEISKLYYDGVDVDEIAQILSMTAKDVKGVMNFNGCYYAKDKVKWKLILSKKDEICRMYEAGCPPIDISEEVGLSRRAIYLYLSFWGKKEKPRHGKHDEICYLLQAGYSMLQIHILLNFDQNHLRDYMFVHHLDKSTERYKFMIAGA